MKNYYEPNTRDNKELFNILHSLDILKKEGVIIRKLSELTEFIPPQNVTVDRKSINVNLISLSPSAESKNKYMQNINSAVLNAIQLKNTSPLLELKDSDHNTISVCLYLEIGNLKLVLGSDLEKGKNNYMGWRAIYGNSDISKKPLNLLKIPHHGSRGAHHEELIKLYSSKNDITSVVTPYIRTKDPLPTDADINRIKSFSKRLGITSIITGKRADPLMNKEIGRLLKNHTRKNIAKTWGDVLPGFVRVRFDINGKLIDKYSLPPAQWIQ